MSEYDFEKLNQILDGQAEPSNYNSNANQTLQQKGNLPLAIIGGCISSILIASLWAVITYNAQAQWVIMGIVAGLVVGTVVHLMSQGTSLSIAIVGGFFALLSCVLGDYFTNVGFIAQNEGVEYFQALSMIDNTYFFEIAFLDFDFFSIIKYFRFIIITNMNSLFDSFYIFII